MRGAIHALMSGERWPTTSPPGACTQTLGSSTPGGSGTRMSRSPCLSRRTTAARPANTVPYTGVSKCGVSGRIEDMAAPPAAGGRSPPWAAGGYGYDTPPAFHPPTHIRDASAALFVSRMSAGPAVPGTISPIGAPDMRLLRILAMATAVAALLAQPSAAQGGRQFKDAWFWGAKTGTLVYSSATTNSSAAPLFGGEWLITRTHGGLYVAFDQTYLTTKGGFAGRDLTGQAVTQYVD